MADYKELLRRAISALPENNGAARRAVYEKARSALVGQLRAIQPPLPARDITQHRLQLEDCIRQVEQEASEAVINLGRESAAAARPAPTPAAPRRPEPAKVEAPKPEPEPEPVIVAAAPDVAPEPEPAPEPAAVEAEKPKPAPVEPKRAEEKPVQSIEDIIAEAAATSGAEVKPTTDAVSEKISAPPPPEPIRRPEPAKTSFFAPRRDPAVSAPANTAAVAAVSVAPARIEPSLGSTALARQPVTEPVIVDQAPVEAALSSVREVELEDGGAREAEGAIERAIETLDREARGEATEPLPERVAAAPASATPENQERSDDGGFATADAEPRSGAGLTIFLVVFALLLVGVGGAGYWAWREQYIDLDQMFGRATPVTETAQTTQDPALPTLNTTPITSGDEGAAGPGNTATTTATEPTAALEGLEPEERLEPTPEAVEPTGNETVLPDISANGEIKTEERLSNEDTSIAAADPAASVDPVNLAGNQSLLLEASTDGQSGAVPFSGTVDWTKGTDELGLPTLQAEASIPARNLDVSVTIRKNNDPILPASHLMEISFDVPDTFLGGSIATLAGVLLKDQELVPGTALKGAAARVVGNSFLFALSSSEADMQLNTDLLDSRRWLDLAIVYGTGRNAILTLEKDETAQVLFDEVLAAWEAP